MINFCHKLDFGCDMKNSAMFSAEESLYPILWALMMEMTALCKSTQPFAMEKSVLSVNF
jgi:hypothetical protein